MDKCINCNFPVRPRQEGLQCDGCSRWQHRTFNTGVSQQDYHAAVQAGLGIEWQCEMCSLLSPPVFSPPVMESTRLESSADLDQSPLLFNDIESSHQQDETMVKLNLIFTDYNIEWLALFHP